MKKIAYLVVPMVGFPLAMNAQESDHDQIMAVANGVQESLSSQIYGLEQWFMSRATPAFGVSDGGFPLVRYETVANSVERLKFMLGMMGEIEEPMTDIDIEIYEGKVASLTAGYEFKRDGNVINRGTTLWSLARTDQGWRIVSWLWTNNPLDSD